MNPEAFADPTVEPVDPCPGCGRGLFISRVGTGWQWREAAGRIHNCPNGHVPSMYPTLTIYIPTIGRPTLSTLLRSLEIQLADPDVLGAVDVWVSDNSGDAEETCAQYPWVNYERQSHDIGVDANVLRSVAVGDGEYLWVIGDDDWVICPDLPREGQTDFRSSLQRILDELPGLDRLILLTSESASRIPALEGGPFSAGQLLEELRYNATLLIAATLISANVYRRAALDVNIGLRHWDSYYNLSWAGITAEKVDVLREPVIGVGWGGGSIPNPREVWQDYLDGLCLAAGVQPISIEDASRWNFAALAKHASRQQVDA